MVYGRRYVQYNDLVFDEAEMITSDSFSASFKDNSTEYSYGHGSYAPLKSKTGLVRSASVSLTLTLRMAKLPCDQREFYQDFAKDQLFEAGKLWAVHGNHLEWAFAYITSYNETNGPRSNTVEIDVDFALPEGYWHRADLKKTFLIPYNHCDVLECHGYRKPLQNGCCACDKPVIAQCDCCCEEVTEDMALLHHQDEIGDFFGCEVPYQIKYDCIAADNFFDLGQRFCSECGGVIAGIYYSDTNLPTDNIKIVIHGKVKNPRIEINGNLNIINGEYEGTLVINPDGSIWHSTDISCTDCDTTLIDPGVWEIPTGNTYGWEIHHGNNQVIIETNACCGTVCAYIDADSITL